MASRMDKPWVSWNVRGLGKSSKRYAVKMALSKIKPAVIMIQETKINENNGKVLVDWANGMNFEIESVPADGSMGGLMMLWKIGYFDVVNVVKSQRFLILFVKFPNITEPCLLANVYGPNNDDERANFFADHGQIMMKGTLFDG